MTIFPYLISKWTYLKYFEIFKMTVILKSGDLLNRKLYRKLSLTSRQAMLFPTFWDFDRHSSSNIKRVNPGVSCSDHHSSNLSALGRISKWPFSQYMVPTGKLNALTVSGWQEKHHKASYGWIPSPVWGCMNFVQNVQGIIHIGPGSVL